MNRRSIDGQWIDDPSPTKKIKKLTCEVSGMVTLWPLIEKAFIRLWTLSYDVVKAVAPEQLFELLCKLKL